ncbi:hypothetical protein BDV38DRAFT_274330 [Aspergillus pseudotamarii]|uniref:Uncharacterized protein n=1 Tax=Aspergillus pseudotamarii TaxID=132259 RepID=A0A5N6SJT6_ASPPS|nr:uncharacterized protein BDV38DRAFT_274330 [Aspergillus pseudotamarii]KAE8133364.1 hypothetical protein BDV38DRAFT_274330 [Aspergillus pseudotamarii]
MRCFYNLSNSPNLEKQTKVILRLRDKGPTERNKPRVAEHPRDGPRMSDTSRLESELTDQVPDTKPAAGVTMGEYSASFKEDRQKAIKTFRELRVANRLDEVEFQWSVTFYLISNNIASLRMIEWFGADWGLNGRGWVTAGHDLWVPSLDGIDWNHSSESSRRSRVKLILSSEYAWEADAWTHIFGQMRDAPVLASRDKHEYNTIKLKRDPVSCLLVGEPKFIKRIPDATFGLATFNPKDYQSPLAEWNLDHDRLEARLLHRHCGLISDPRWGDANLAFPFAVYEAKGWSGDAQEARRQGCSAGAVYLDINNQVVIFTSFGAHWHILVGYKRPRLEREYAGHDGFSEPVYHEFRRRCYTNDVASCLQLADWAKHLSEEARGKLRERVISYFQQAYPRDLPDLTDNWPAVITCLLDGCGPVGTPGYPIQSKEGMAAHYREVHGEDDEVIADLKRPWGEREETNNNDNPVQPTKRERLESGEPGSCAKRVAGIYYEQFSIHERAS